MVFKKDMSMLQHEKENNDLAMRVLKYLIYRKKENTQPRLTISRPGFICSKSTYREL